MRWFMMIVLLLSACVGSDGSFSPPPEGGENEIEVLADADTADAENEEAAELPEGADCFPGEMRCAENEDLEWVGIERCVDWMWAAWDTCVQGGCNPSDIECCDPTPVFGCIDEYTLVEANRCTGEEIHTDCSPGTCLGGECVD